MNLKTESATKAFAASKARTQTAAPTWPWLVRARLYLLIGRLRRSHETPPRRAMRARSTSVLLAAWLAAAFPVVAQTTNHTGFAAFQIISQRNIFNQSRMPHERAPQPTRVPDSFSLVGTMLYAGDDVAFFNGTSSDFRKALKVDGDIAGFKVTAITLDSVTLTNGTNQTVLKVSSQMRRDDDGSWSVSTEKATYASLGGPARSLSRQTLSNRSAYGSGSSRRNFSATTGAVGSNGADNGFSSPEMGEAPPPHSETNPPAAPASPGGANSALERLMQRRAQEEQRLNQGQ